MYIYNINVNIDRQLYILCISYTFCSLTKRSFKGFLLTFFMAGQCHSPRLVPPGASPKLKVPPKFPKFLKVVLNIIF